MIKTGVRWKSAIHKALVGLREHGLLDQATVVLIGSIVRDADSSTSDIDLLVVTPEAVPRIPIGGNLQLFRMTRSEFVRRLECGDDFPQWALRYGRVISDVPHWWDEVRTNEAVEKWPDWRRKVDQARERLRFATPLRESGDYDHAQEELLLAARHLARGTLLKEQVFPLSQPELPSQLQGIGYPNLAELLDSLVGENVTPAALADAEATVQSQIERLSE